MPLVTSSVSATPEHESGIPTDSITGLNLRTIGASERFVISLDSSYHSSTNASGAEVDFVIRSVVVPPVMTEAVITFHAVNASSVLVPETGTKIPSPVHASMFHDSDSTETMKADIAGPSYFSKQDLSMGSRELNSKILHQVFVSRWNIREIDYHHLFIEFNVGTARQACLNAEVRMRTEYCLSSATAEETKVTEAAHLRTQVSTAEATEKMHDAEIDALKQRNVTLKNEKESLDGKVAELQSSFFTKDLELKGLNAAVSSLRSQKDGLVDQVNALETTCSGLRDQVSGYERLKEKIVEFQDAQMNIVNDKLAKLDADLLEMALYLEEKIYPHLLTTISGRRWLLTQGLKLAIVKCLNSLEYLSALRAVISRAIEKGMQDGLSADINHGKTGRSLADVVAYNPSAEVYYNSALQRLREVDFPLLAELKFYKDESTVDVMDLLCLEDQVVLGETSLSFALSVTHSQVEKIRENVAAQRSALINVWVSLVDPLSAKSLIGEASTSSSVPAAAMTTTALSTTFASVTSVPLITIKDYEIVVEFKKEELDTTPERDPPS
ncbi:hypothetical protein Tco_0241396 [Tanacetum coccineum]